MLGLCDATGPSRMTTIGINGLCVPLSDCWDTCGIGWVTRMEVMSLSGNAPGNHNPPGIPGLSSCLCRVLIKDFCIDGVVWCFGVCPAMFIQCVSVH